MDISDAIFNQNTPLAVKQALIEVIDTNFVTDAYIKILIPTDSNDDLNGSQHVSGGDNDFTYRDATEDEVREATTLGYYEYFSEYGGEYTGHYYNGSDQKFAAIVIDPPAYAVAVHI
jgi:hypothetical protein